MFNIKVKIAAHAVDCDSFPLLAIGPYNYRRVVNKADDFNQR